MSKIEDKFYKKVYDICNNEAINLSMLTIPHSSSERKNVIGYSMYACNI